MWRQLSPHSSLPFRFGIVFVVLNFVAIVITFALGIFFHGDETLILVLFPELLFFGFIFYSPISPLGIIGSISLLIVSGAVTIIKAFFVGYVLGLIYVKSPRLGGFPYLFFIILTAIITWVCMGILDKSFTTEERMQVAKTVEDCRKYFEPQTNSMLDCALKIAKIENNIRACDLLAGGEGNLTVEGCYIKFAVKTAQPAVCDSYELSEDYRILCHREVLSCEKLTQIKSSYAANVAGGCWEDKAYTEFNSNYCERIQDGILRDRCHRWEGFQNYGRRLPSKMEH